MENTNIHKWRIWAVGESLSKIISATFQKLIGLTSQATVGTILGIFVIGAVQSFLAILVQAIRGKSVLGSKSEVLFSCLFGTFAFVATVFSLTAYRLGGDVGVVVFIISLSIIPGAIIDTIIYKNRLNFRQWLGVTVGIVGGYFVLGAPGLYKVSTFPLWALCAFGTAFSIAINQGVDQRIKNIDPLVKNFWGGLTTVMLAILAFIFVRLPDLSSDSFQKVVVISIPIGFATIGMWTFSVFAYREGVHIAEKKLMMNGLYLTFAMIVGVFFYKETFTFGKGLGLPTFLIASILFNNKLWESFRGFFQKR